MLKIKLKRCAGCNLEKVIWKSSGKDKYCKECWYSIEKPKPIPKIAKKQKKVLDEYSKKRIAYLALYPFCQAKLHNCTHYAVEIHHKAGKVGKLYTLVSNFLAVCRSCHNWLENHSKEAKEMNFSESRLNNRHDEEDNST